MTRCFDEVKKWKLATASSLDSERSCAKIIVVGDAVMEVRMLPPGQERRDD